MLIQCTKKLLDELGIKNPLQKEEPGLFSWHANLITFNRRKTMVMVNDNNRYAIILYGLKKRDFEHLNEIILAGIRNVFRDEGIDEAVIDEYLSRSGEMVFARTRDRSSITRVNQAAQEVDFYSKDVIEGEIIQRVISRKISRVIIGPGRGGKDYTYPNQELLGDLEKLWGGSVIKCRAAIIKVKLDLEKFDVWRRLVIPLNYTFVELHDALQVAFGWWGLHLHEFYIYGDKGPVNWSYVNHPGFHKEGYKPVLNLVCDEDAFTYRNDVEMKLEGGIRLSELPFRLAKYNYDFGDDWQHYIVVEKLIDDFSFNHPVCLDGSGDAPPEDVGGEAGYECFVEAMADENHPEHNDYKLWSKSKIYEEFDLDLINRRLRFV
ncbi:MAG TPA: plasmid pRiA4b ORF-3 family protein [Syntrophomonadaceae bacterium]|nr:plasmid pRiA4b ORF-3 family protein [Syntrophomonadaceae bacterium]